MADYGTDHRKYNDPYNGTPSDIGPQMNDFYWQRNSLIEAKKTAFFGQMADVTAMPKHYGRTIKYFQYVPLLDDANINDQGIDANGVTTTRQFTIIITPPKGDGVAGGHNLYLSHYAVGEGADDAAAQTAAEARAVDTLKNELQVTAADDYPTARADAIAAGYAVDDSADAVPVGGNLYGSSKDIGNMLGKMPRLDENGGRKNRVGFKRKDIEGSFAKYGFFDEYTKESVDFDSDPELRRHVNREMINGAHEITEDSLQIDLLNGAGIVRLGGVATKVAELTGEGTDISLITYQDLKRLDRELTENRCPKQTTIITGSTYQGTDTIEAARFLHIGTESQDVIENMVDNFGNPAFIPVRKYAAAGTLARGEIGAVGPYRVIVVPEMAHWAGAGADVTANEGYRETNGKYDVFPMLVIGEGSFTTIGFQTSGRQVKFKIKHVMPESETAYGPHDPYGEKGFMSIKWYYGSLIMRPERLAVLKQVAPW